MLNFVFARLLPSSLVVSWKKLNYSIFPYFLGVMKDKIVSRSGEAFTVEEERALGIAKTVIFIWIILSVFFPFILVRIGALS